MKKFSAKNMSISDPKLDPSTSVPSPSTSGPNSATSTSSTSTSSSASEKIKPEACLIFVSDNEKGNTIRQLSDFELITVCHSQNRRERDRLIICPKNTTPTQAQIASSKQIIKNYNDMAAAAAAAANGSSNSNGSNSNNNVSSGKSGTLDTLTNQSKIPFASGSSSTLGDPSYYQQPHSANSILSFEESEFYRHNGNSSGNHSQNPNGSTSDSGRSVNAMRKDMIPGGGGATFIRSSKKRITDVQGFRPESMHISKNLESLQEYFPEAGTKVLRQTIRNSQMYTKRMSRMSRLSQRSSIAMYYPHEFQDDDAPPLPSLEDVWNQTMGLGAYSTSRAAQPLPTGPGQGPSSTSSSPSLGHPSSNVLYNHRNSSLSNASASGASSNGPNTPTSATSSRLSTRSDRPNSSSSVASYEEKTLPPVPGGGHQQMPQSQPPSISRRASNMSIRSTMSNRVSQTDVQGTLTPSSGNNNNNLPDPPQNPADIPDDEEQFMELFKREQSGPSRWIKGALIGSGSFGTVYLGLNSVTGELMAVKQVEMLGDKGSEQEQRKRSMIDALQREMNLLRDLQHPNIVQYLGSNCDSNFLNIFLEYVPGGSVATMLVNCGAFEESHIRKVVKQILHGLKYLHSRSIIHRDIKGANVLMDTQGTVKISDFGISKKLEDKNARASLQGSIYWMAPEVVKQMPYTFKADIWSLGCLVVEMYTGKRPFPELQHFQALFNIGKEAPVPPSIPPHASLEGQDFLRKAFEIDYHKRPTAADMLLHEFVNNDFGQPLI